MQISATIPIQLYAYPSKLQNPVLESTFGCLYLDQTDLQEKARKES